MCICIYMYFDHCMDNLALRVASTLLYTQYQTPLFHFYMLKNITQNNSSEAFYCWGLFWLGFASQQFTASTASVSRDLASR